MSELVDLVDRTGVIRERRIPIENAANYYPPSKTYPEGLHLQIAIAVVFNGLGQHLVQQRALSKRSDPGYLDHICGIVSTGEDPRDTAIRETAEEGGGLYVPDLTLVDVRMNTYNRFRRLYAGWSNRKPGRADPKESIWVGFRSDEQIREFMEKYPAVKLVGEFEENLEIARGALDLRKERLGTDPKKDPPAFWLHDVRRR